MRNPKSLGIYAYANSGISNVILREMDNKLEFIPSNVLIGTPSQVYSAIITAKGETAPSNALEQGNWTSLLKNKAVANFVYGIPKSVKVNNNSKYDLVRYYFKQPKMPKQRDLNKRSRM